MKKIQSVLSRFRLLTSILALALALTALSATPSSAQGTLGGYTCETSCVYWSQYFGCLQSLRCCVNNRTNDYFCYPNGGI